MDVEEIIDRLYELPVEKFTHARNQAERELRKGGEREQAEQVKALRKPTAPAAAANRLVRAHRAQVEGFLDAAATLRDAQVAGKGDLATAARAERQALEELVTLGGEAVRATLQAAAVDDNTARELLEARLVREPESAGFGTLLAHAKPSAAKSTSRRAAAEGPRTKRPTSEQGSTSTKRPEAKPLRPDDSAARRRLREAKEVLAAAAAEERQARRRWTQTQRELDKAQTGVAKAQHELDRLRAH